ncbi:Tetraspanin [Schistosoma japonicum]|uniref:Tetraspanin n=1 Tax=Schistosoma japonicum TaxID=6182 RepID=A0A4Z2DA04_SCHJA|nr:Tetraspanin [Schistosoma japonicum]
MSSICILRCILALINILIGVIAATVAVIGGIYTWGEKSLHNTLHMFAIDSIGNLTVRKGFAKLFFKIFEEIQPFGIYIFVAGLVIFIICLFGFIGTCFKSRIMICIYLTLHSLILIPEIIIIIVYFCRPDLVTTLTRNVFNSSVQRYIGYDSPDIHSYALNHIMIQLQCCGLNNGSDFDRVKLIKRNIIYKGEEYEFKYPVSCCKMDRNQEITNNGCPDQFNLANSNIHIGCWPKIEQFFVLASNITAQILCGIVGFQVLLILFGLILLRTSRKIKPI